ncbi:MAG: hypothetical protein U1F11_00700 [Steroidobacteraceae bacterium]
MLQTTSFARARAQGAALLAATFTLGAMLGGPAVAASRYDPSTQELEAVLDDLKAWLPGGWDSFPQVWHERTVRAPLEGEHEHWYRTFALIDAPQVGKVVFYGQINMGGRDGPMMPRTQILYTAEIDEKRGVVNVNGQTMVDPEKYEDLHRHPELWKEVRQRDPAAIKCDFVWRRSGPQIVGVLDGKTEERRKYGPGTCNYQNAGNQEFLADAEWVLSPDELWLYDINKLNGMQFIGRHDQTHIRLYRARSYRCSVADRDGTRTLDAYDRGYTAPVTGRSGRKASAMLLRAPYPHADGRGLEDRLRLMLLEPDSTHVLASADAAPVAPRVELQHDGVTVKCELAPAGH